jgi:anti-sigma B factor antagonist
LTIDRLIARSGGRIVLVGVADAVKDAISMTGLLNLFTLCDTIDDGMKAL